MPRLSDLVRAVENVSIDVAKTTAKGTKSAWEHARELAFEKQVKYHAWKLRRAQRLLAAAHAYNQAAKEQ